MDHQSIDQALGIDGQPPQPLITGLTATERDAVLERSLWFPDRSLPTGELADWAVALIDLGKDAAVLASVAALETAVDLTPAASRDLPFVHSVLTELHLWINSTQQTEDLRRLGDLWWTLTRNPPQSADTPLGDAAIMAWLVAGYDPEGWGNPPEDLTKLLDWINEAANNVTAVVDVFSCLQQSVGPDNDAAVLAGVRCAIRKWRDPTAASSNCTGAAVPVGSVPHINLGGPVNWVVTPHSTKEPLMEQSRSKWFAVCVCFLSLTACVVLFSRYSGPLQPQVAEEPTGVIGLSVDSIAVSSPMNCSVAECNIPAHARSLNGRRVRIRGVMHPTFSIDNITEYILIPETNHEAVHVNNVSRLPLHGLISVSTPRGHSESHPEQDMIYPVPSILVEGTFEVQMRENGGKVFSVYELRDATIVRKGEPLEGHPAVAVFGC